MKKLKLTSLNENNISKTQMDTLRGGGNGNGGGTCEGCLCDDSVPGQLDTNNNKARSSAGVAPPTL